MRLKLLMVTLAALAFAGCGQREQVAQAERGYQGKPDGKSWENAPLAYDQPKWEQGNRASWEAQIKNRQLAQHEDRRINE
jgi:hypothetical protein